MLFTLLLQWIVSIGSERSFNPHLFISILIDRPNGQDWGGGWTRRTAFMRHLKTVLEELDIRYTNTNMVLAASLLRRCANGNARPCKVVSLLRQHFSIEYLAFCVS